MRGFYGKLQTNEELKSITINEGFEQFQTYNIAKNLAPHSISYYKDNVERFLKFHSGEQM